MSTPTDVFRDALQKTFQDIWSNAAVMILAIIFLLAIAEGIGIWIDWKLHGKRRT